MSEIRIPVINGFDRSGTGFSSGLLAKNPKVNLLFQPFFRSEVHLSKHLVWRPDREAEETAAFLKKMLQGSLDQDYIKGEFFKRFSTAFEIEGDKINLIKETTLHFAVPWFLANFPQIKIYGLWRDPIEILFSLMRNNFHYTWWAKKDYQKTVTAIHSEPELAPLKKVITLFPGADRRMAIILTARIFFFACHLPVDSWISYRRILADPNDGLSLITKAYGIDDYDYSQHISEDFNSLGKKFEKARQWEDYFSKKDLLKYQRIFAPLEEIKPQF